MVRSSPVARLCAAAWLSGACLAVADRSLAAGASAGSQEAAAAHAAPPTTQPAGAAAHPGSVWDLLAEQEAAPLDPAGFSGPTTVLFPREVDPSDGFLPIADRWRIGFPVYDRLGQHNPLDPFVTGEISGNYQYQRGHWFDPYNQNVLKGDYPLIGDQIFFSATLILDTYYEFRQLPTPSGESASRPERIPFFGDQEQHFFSQNLIGTFELFHGASSYKPFDWKFRFTPIFNVNYTEVEELGVTNIDVRRGRYRTNAYFSVQELFLELKLADLSPQYDFVSVRMGRQPFVSDFRGFIFADVAQGVRIFGSNEANRDQWNIAWFFQAEKETNSELNTWDARHQQVIIANYYRQDSLDFEWLPPGYRKGFTQTLSFHFNLDDQRDRNLHFDRNGFLVRPDPIGSFEPHDLRAAYFGWGGDGHIGRLNLMHQFYWVVGRDTFNAIAGKQERNQALIGSERETREITINAQMFAIEPSVDIDWLRLRTGFLWASGDSSPQDREGRGFDGILENPNFAGGQFSYWNRQGIRLLNTNLVNRNSLFPDLSSSKIEGQSNFVNPGLFLLNAGFDVEVTPKLKTVVNANYLWFDDVEPLELLLKQPGLSNRIGLDVSLGFIYRPLLNNNVIFTAGVAALFPGAGFAKIYEESDPLYQVFTSLTLKY